MCVCVLILAQAVMARASTTIERGRAIQPIHSTNEHHQRVVDSSIVMPDLACRPLSGGKTKSERSWAVAPPACEAAAWLRERRAAWCTSARAGHQAHKHRPGSQAQRRISIGPGVLAVADGVSAPRGRDRHVTTALARLQGNFLQNSRRLTRTSKRSAQAFAGAWRHCSRHQLLVLVAVRDGWVLGSCGRGPVGVRVAWKPVAYFSCVGSQTHVDLSRRWW